MTGEKFLASMERLGLTPMEARVYAVLLEKGMMSAQGVAASVSVHYPAIYRVLTSLEEKGWAEATRGRPKRYRARNPTVVAGEAKRSVLGEIERAEAVVSTLENYHSKEAKSEPGDLWIYKGPQAVYSKLREIVLSADDDILAVAPRWVDASVLKRLLAIVSSGSRPAKLLFHRSNARDVKALRNALRRNIHIEARLPGKPPGRTMLTHTFIFPNNREVFVLNTVVRDGQLQEDQTMGLWISDADYVRIQLDDMMISAS